VLGFSLRLINISSNGEEAVEKAAAMVARRGALILLLSTAVVALLGVSGRLIENVRHSVR
jgi:hypothetical protein